MMQTTLLITFTIYIVSVANIVLMSGRPICLYILVCLLSEPMNTTMQHLTHTTACFLLVLHFVFHGNTDHVEQVCYIYHVTFQ